MKSMNDQKLNNETMEEERKWLPHLARPNLTQSSGLVQSVWFFFQRSHPTFSTTHLRYTGDGRYSQQTENKQPMRHRNANIDCGILVQIFLCRHLTIKGTKQATLNQLIARWKAAIHHRGCSATTAAWLRTPDGWWGFRRGIALTQVTVLRC